jgi:hypothetical protein
VAQDRQRVERFTRQPPGKDWLLTEVSEPEGVLRLASVDCDLALAALYEQVELPPGGAPHPRVS